MDARTTKLESIKKRYLEINDELIKDEVASDIKKYTKLSKEQASLKAPYEAYEEYSKLQETIAGANEMLKEKDPEIVAMAKEEKENAENRLQELDKKIDTLLIPRDPEDAYDCLVEIRGAAGGDEGNIFAGDLFRMYENYAHSLGYKVDVMESSESEAGGYALISFSVKGQDAYRHFKFESGAHRVQRVPKTETQGRVHTSTATVIVFPDVEEEDVEIPDSDLTIETHRASGAGGQHINKTDSAVRIVHIPTGITVNCQDGRNQIANKETAMKIIRARVYDYYKQKKEEEEGAIRRSKIGTGDRSEKIRTYNYPQNRVSDHRIGLTINQLDRIVEGKLDDVVNALIKNEEDEKMLNG